MYSAGGAAPNRLTTNDALSYLRDVKIMFQDNREVYETFLEIMKEFKAQTLDTQGVIKRVKHLFKGHRDLIIGFNTFLPKGYEIKMEDLIREEHEEKAAAGPKPPIEFDQAISYVNKIKDRFKDNEGVYKSFLELLNQYRKQMKGIKEVYDQVSSLFKDHDDLLEAFTYFLPDSQVPHKLAMEQQRQEQLHREMEQSSRRRPAPDQSGPMDIKECVSVFSNMRKKVSQSLWLDLLKLLGLFAEDILQESELIDLMAAALANYNELSSTFESFMRRVPNMLISADTVEALTRAVCAKATTLVAPKKNYANLAMSDLDFRDCERCTTSYVALPAEYPAPKCSGRSKLSPAIQNLPFNDKWVSVTQGSEDYSFRLMRRNQYEEILFRIEDDRFDLDLLIERNKSCIAKLETVALDLARMGQDDRNNAKLKDGELSQLQRSHIKRLYAESGAAMLDALQENPMAAVPTILARLEQMEETWTQTLREMEKQWQKMFDQNYSRSLDHRSFYFKAFDKRHLGNKLIMQELRDAADLRKKTPESALQLHTSAPRALKCTPDLILDMPDRAVHGDVWMVIGWASHLFSPSDCQQQIRQFWTGVIAPLFGIPDIDALVPDVIDAAGPTEGDPAGRSERMPAAGTGAGVNGSTPLESTEGTAEVASNEGDVEMREQQADSTDDAAAMKDARVAHPEAPGDTVADSNRAGRQSLGAAAACARGRSNVAGLDLAMTGESGGPREGGSGAHTSIEAPATPPAATEAAGMGHDLSRAETEAKAETDDEMDDQEAGSKLGAAAMEIMEDDDDNVSELPGEREDGKLGGIGIFEDSSKASVPWEPRPVRAIPPPELALQLPGQDGRTTEVSELYCNDNIYIFLRLYHYLYDRLRTARTCVQEKVSSGYKPRTLTTSTENGTNTSTSSDASKLRNDFFVLLHAHLGGHVDVNCFEDQCRAMLGTNSYVLFTLLKLVQRIIRLLQHLIADDASVKLINLQTYERRRTTKVSWATRHANASCAYTDDHTVRAAVREDGSVAVSLLPLDRPEAHFWRPDSEAAAYMERFMRVTEAEVFEARFPHAGGAHGRDGGALGASQTSGRQAKQRNPGNPWVFLHRNLNPSVQSTPDERANFLDTFYVFNALECKIRQHEFGSMKEGAAQHTRKAKRVQYKLGYVEDTADLLVRKRRKCVEGDVKQQMREKQGALFKSFCARAQSRAGNVGFGHLGRQHGLVHANG